jgi:hypothetical protein
MGPRSILGKVLYVCVASYQFHGPVGVSDRSDFRSVDASRGEAR